MPVRFDEQWGLDHGTWAVLCHVYPHADIPVVQLSIDENQPPSFHYEIGKRLAPLRDEGILIVGSGNLVHNLHAYAWGRHAVEPYDWAVSFESRVRELLLAEKHNPLIDYGSKLGSEATLAVPTPDHYLTKPNKCYAFILERNRSISASPNSNSETGLDTETRTSPA
jgi:4,5-DOPA dioxygenase extradiol